MHKPERLSVQLARQWALSRCLGVTVRRQPTWQTERSIAARWPIVTRRGRPVIQASRAQRSVLIRNVAGHDMCVCCIRQTRFRVCSYLAVNTTNADTASEPAGNRATYRLAAMRSSNAITPHWARAEQAHYAMYWNTRLRRESVPLKQGREQSHGRVPNVPISLCALEILALDQAFDALLDQLRRRTEPAA